MDSSPDPVYPPEIIGNTLQDHVSEFRGQNNSIYFAVTGFLVAGLAALPLVHVNVSVMSEGILRPEKSKATVHASQSGIIERVYSSPGDTVSDGTPLMRLHETPIQDQQKVTRKKLKRKKDFVDDLTRLIEVDAAPIQKNLDLKTAQYRQEYTALENELRKHSLKLRRARRDLERKQKLFASKSIAEETLEDIRFDYEQLRSRRQIIIDKYRRRWLSSLAQLRSEVQTLRGQMREMTHQEILHFIRAPLKGTVSQMQGLAHGSYVRSGQEIAVISPDADLVARVRVPPTDIGLLRRSDSAHFQIHAYDYQNWGFATGEIERISSDVQMQNGKPTYIVECSLHSEFLSLPNGTRGTLKKGMTLTARFPVTRRSLWELLYQDISDYLNPKDSSA